MRTKLIDMTVFLHFTKPKQILVSEDEDSAKVWLPISEIRIASGDEQIDHGPIDISAPEWLLVEAGLA